VDGSEAPQSHSRKMISLFKTVQRIMDRKGGRFYLFQHIENSNSCWELVKVNQWDPPFQEESSVFLPSPSDLTELFETKPEISHVQDFQPSYVAGSFDFHGIGQSVGGIV
jgi:hypothetical protein